MSRVKIRDVKAEDLFAIKTIIDKTWNWADLVENKQVLNATLGIYLNQILYNSSFGKVAALDGDVVGVIFGFAENEISKYRMLQEDGTEHALALSNATEKERKDVCECISKLNETYAKLISDAEDSYDGTIVFFVVSKEARGLGIGKSLWYELCDYFKEKNVKSIYVCSDTDCNFGFYEYSGFQRRGEQDLTCNFHDGDWKVKVILYEYKF